MTEAEWKNRIAHISNADPKIGELRAQVEQSCWAFLARLRDHGIPAALEVKVGPIGSRDEAA